jgi:hypothetical protein
MLGTEGSSTRPVRLPVVVETSVAVGAFAAVRAFIAWSGATPVIRCSRPYEDSNCRRRKLMSMTAGARHIWRPHHRGRGELLAIAASIALLTFGVLQVPAVEASTLQTESVAVLLVSDPSHPMPIRVSDVKRYSLSFLNRWYRRVSYGAFRGFNPAQAGSVSKSDGVSCDAQTMWTWALHTFPNSSADYVVVVPGSACPSTGATVGDLGGQHFAFFTDRNFVHTASPTAYAVYNTVMELGHSLLGPAHANSLDCTTAFDLSCYTAGSTVGPLGGISGTICAQRDGTVPYFGEICAYGDPWDAMGNDFPESTTFAVGTIPGDAWLNGIELNKAGWLTGREATAGQGVWAIRPLEHSSGRGAPQVLWIPAVPNSLPRIEMEYRHPAPSPSPFSHWLDGFLTGCVTTGVDCGWPEITGGVLFHAVSADAQSQSLLLDSTPDSNRPALCPTGTTNGLSNNAFCDWYDAAVQPGASNSFVPNGPYIAPYYVTVLSAGATGASVAVNDCPCQDSFSPSSGDFGQVPQGGTKSLTFTLTNNAVAVTHTIASPSITGSDAGAFSIVSNTCAALSPGASCEITISFHPSAPAASNAGTYNAALTVNDTNPVFPTETLNLSGTLPVSTQHVVINFDDLPQGGLTGVVVTNQYPTATFSSTTGNVNYVTTQPQYIGTNGNFICTGPDPGSIDCMEDTFVNFTAPVNGLTFDAIGVNDTGQVAVVDVYNSSGLVASVPIIGNAGVDSPQLVDLSAYSNITEIHIRNITDGGGIGWDNFSFDTTSFGGATTAQSANAVTLSVASQQARPKGSTGALRGSTTTKVNIPPFG